MKKLPLAIAALSLFAASNSFSQQFNQEFEVSLNIPSSVDVTQLYREVVNLDMADLSKAANSDGVLIGSMNIQTTARNCAARIMTDNNFRLKDMSGTGTGTGTGTEFPYTIEYIATNETGSQLSTTFGADPYGNYNDQEKAVGCNVGDLKMRLSRMESGSYLQTGIYNDVIRVEVRAES